MACPDEVGAAEVGARDADVGVAEGVSSDSGAASPNPGPLVPEPAEMVATGAADSAPPGPATPSWPPRRASTVDDGDRRTLHAAAPIRANSPSVVVVL